MSAAQAADRGHISEVVAEASGHASALAPEEVEDIEILVGLVLVDASNLSSIDHGEALVAGVDPATLSDFQTGLDAANGAAAGASAERAAACIGDTKLAYSWPNTHILLNTCQMGTIIGLVNGAAGVATIAGALSAMLRSPVAAGISAVAAGVIVVGGTYLSVCNSWGRGVLFHHNGVVLTCQSQ